MAPQRDEAIPNGLYAGFVHPPQEARPRVWWHWVSGNVSAPGITADLEWMKRAGIAGFQMFDGDLGMHTVVDHPVVWGTSEWRDDLRHAAAEADRLGLEMAVSSSGGWSELGGPSVTPAQAMKKYVWSETEVHGGRHVHLQLVSPPHTTGPIQELLGDRQPNFYLAGHAADAEWYRDTVVVAFRKVLHADQTAPMVSSDLIGLDATRLIDGDRNVSVPLVPGASAKESSIEFRYDHPVAINAVAIAAGTRWATAGERPQPPMGRWESSNDGQHWTTLAVLPGALESWLVWLPVRTYAFPRTKARYFRLCMDANALRSSHQELAEIEPIVPPRINNWEDKAGFGGLIETYDVPTPEIPPDEAIRHNDVVDLTSRILPDGALDWDAPAGEWTVLRFGYSLTGKQNEPAMPAATGLETDKLSAEHVRAYLASYTARIAASTGPYWGKSLRYLLMDSWECANENWTEGLIDEFRKRRGYDLVPYLPVLTGRVVESTATSEAVLWDLRRTLADLLADNYYGQADAYLHAHGLGLYAEAMGPGLPTVGDGLLNKSKVDIPMGEFWVPSPGKRDGIKHLLDVKEAASAAHIYGKTWVGAESFTTGGEVPPWDQGPLYLKLLADEQFSAGLNRLVVSDYAHQPFADDSHKPGLLLGVYGAPFNRNLTWADQAGAWIDYLARCSYMLSRGKPVADVAYFFGENALAYQPYWKNLHPEMPLHYDADWVDADVLRSAHVENGRLVLASGASYGVLVLPADLTSLSVPMAEKLESLVRAGMILLAPKPAHSPTLSDGPAADARLSEIAGRLWGTNNGIPHSVGLGKVFSTGSIEGVLLSTGTTPDVLFSALERLGNDIPEPLPLGPTGKDFNWAHRSLSDVDIYFLSTPLPYSTRWDVSLRTKGDDVELWDPVTGRTRPAAFEIIEGRTKVRIELAPVGSIFVAVKHGSSFPGRRALSSPKLEHVLDLSDAWDLTFAPGWGAPTDLKLPKLASWSLSTNPGVKYFSGTATYRKAIQLPKGWFPQGGSVMLDLGDVREIAEVHVNGQSADGVLWKPPFLVDISALLHSGTNQIEVRVTNFWRNRLIGDQQPGIRRRYTFTTFKPYPADAPLSDSGLLGPVTLQAWSATH